MIQKTFGAGMALLCAMVGSATAQELPKWLADARARESRLAEPVEVVSEDGWLRSKVPGAVNHKVVLEDEGYSLDIALEGNASVSCEVLRGPRDLAALLHMTVGAAFDAIEKLNGTVEARTLEATDAGAVGPYPFMSLQWLYRTNRDGDKRVGALKQYIAALGDAVVYCANDDLGNAKTFQTVARSLTEHLRTGGDPTPQPFFREVSAISLDGKRVGVAVTAMTKDASGDMKVASKNAMLLEPAPGQLLASDVFEVQWVRPDGSLINAWQASTSNGDVSDEMALKPIEGGRWRASGTIKGKPIDVELPSAPSSHVSMAKARRQIMSQAHPVGARAEAMVWSSIDFTRLLASRVTVVASAGIDRFTVREELAGIAIEAVLDKQTGTMASAKMPMGPRTLVFERLYRQGDF